MSLECYLIQICDSAFLIIYTFPISKVFIYFYSIWPIALSHLTTLSLSLPFHACILGGSRFFAILVTHKNNIAFSVLNFIKNKSTTVSVVSRIQPNLYSLFATKKKFNLNARFGSDTTRHVVHNNVRDAYVHRESGVSFLQKLSSCFFAVRHRDWR